MTKDVTFQHNDYQCAKERWKLVKDAVSGEESVKREGDKYLPRPNPSDTSNENIRRYDSYKLRAVFYNATGRTLRSFTGVAFAKQPVVKIPSGIITLLEDVTGTGIKLAQHAEATVGHVLATGRGGLLVDYPTTGGEVTIADQTAGQVRPTISFYDEMSIVNWKTAKVGGKTILSMVVLRECVSKEDGEFATEEQEQYRVLSLVGGRYRQVVYRKVRNDAGEITWTPGDEAFPTRGNGANWDVIPFQFVGSMNNDWVVDDSPLYDIATINLAHYRNSADYEDSVYLCGQPQFWIAGLSIEWRDHLEKQGVYIGSRSVLPLPEGGSAGILQAQPNTLAKEAMDTKEKQMAALGARMLSGDAVIKTAYQAASEDAAGYSTLATVCNNVAAAYQRALTWCCEFANDAGEVEFKIDNQFIPQQMDPGLLSSLIAAVQSGKLPESDLWTAMRRAGLIDSEKTDEMIREEVASQSPPATGAALHDSAANPDSAGDQVA